MTNETITRICESCRKTAATFRAEFTQIEPETYFLCELCTEDCARNCLPLLECNDLKIWPL